MKKATEILRKGGVVAFPTETVYGLGADATNEEACKKVYELKSRPLNNPMIIHVDSLNMAMDIADFNSEALKLAKIVWPGPLTIVLKKAPNCPICDVALAGLDTVALRVPFNQLAIELISQFGGPIAAPSANISNYISATEAGHVREAFGDDVYLLDRPSTIFGLESTIIDLTDPEKPEILRAGFITDNIISNILGQRVSYRKGGEVKAPGMMKKHYSPHTKLRMNAVELWPDELGLGFGSIDFGGLNLSKSGDLAEAGSKLYSMLRILDNQAIDLGKERIAVAPIQNDGIGIAINDRLKRACG